MIKEFTNLSGYQFPIHDLFERYEYHDAERFCIYDDGLKIPVFHILPDDKYIDICICLFEAKYYQYNHKVYKYAVDGKELNIFLKQPNKNHPAKTNWEWLVEWYKSVYGCYSLNQYNIIDQPDYTKLEFNSIKKRNFIRWIKAKWYA